jgi:two-component system chemotaxis response regulator CheB
MPPRKIRVLVVDDSLVMREVLRDVLSAAADIEVVACAADGRTALAALAAHRTDVVTLDVHMPGMDGLAVLEAILRRRPTAVIMVSALTTAGAAITFDALDRGALDFVAKPDPAVQDFTTFGAELARKVRWAADVDVKRVLAARRPPARGAARRTKPATSGKEPAQACIVIGASTGGPPALTRLMEGLRPPLPPLVIVQHMPAQFTGPLAWRLNECSLLSVSEADDGAALRPNAALVAPGGRHLRVRRAGATAWVELDDSPPLNGHRPSIDVAMRSAAEAFGGDCLGVIMTGMGRDGLAGCAAIRAAGGFVLGQDEATSDVYGMNRLAFESGFVNAQFPLHAAAAAVMRQFIAQPLGV